MAAVELLFASGESSLSVRSFTIEEELNALFRIQVEARSPDVELDVETILGREAGLRIGDGRFHQLRGVAAQVARLERGVGDRRAAVLPLDHREQQVGVGIALRRVQHVVHPAHGCGDPHRPHVGRAFVGPEGEFHAGCAGWGRGKVDGEGWVVAQLRRN